MAYGATFKYMNTTVHSLLEVRGLLNPFLFYNRILTDGHAKWIDQWTIEGLWGRRSQFSLRIHHLLLGSPCSSGCPTLRDNAKWH